MGRTVMVIPDGTEVGFHGVYREVVPNEWIVSTEIYEGVPEEDQADPVLNTVTFVERDGRTVLSLLVDCPTKGVRDAIVESGMEVGLQEGWDRLEEIAMSLRLTARAGRVGHRSRSRLLPT